MSPQRIQLRRTKGWRKPEGTIVVSRPSRWGNPFTLVGSSVAGPKWFDLKFQPLNCGIRKPPLDEVLALYSTHSSRDDARSHAVLLFGRLVTVRLRDRRDEAIEWLTPLIGHDLACWCPLDQECHADVLLTVANRRPL